MKIKLVSRGNEGEVLLDGILDANTMPETERILSGLVERFDRIILNLTLLDSVSTNSLRVIKKLYMDMRKKGGELIIRNANDAVMEVFQVTGFAGLLKFD